MDNMTWGELSPEGRTLSPLPGGLSRGLWAITVLASTSFIVSAVLFFYLTHKLLAWGIYVRRRPNSKRSFSRKSQDEHEAEDSQDFKQHRVETRRHSSQHVIDFTLGIDGVFTEHPNTSQDASVITNKGFRGERSPPSKPSRRPPNQLLILIYNLLLADLHQGLAFALNGSWIYNNGIIVHTATCCTQGFLVSTGDLSSSMFITLIAIHTYLSLVKGYRPSQNVLYIAIVLVWLFVYLISMLPIFITHNGADVGGFFVRAGAWCWINPEYEKTRLLTHYLWIFIALAATSALYLAIWFSLRRQAGKRANNPGASSEPDYHASHNPAFLIYPIIYVLCTLPLAIGRATTMAGVIVPIEYMCFAGALISFNGFLDCLLFGTTRGSIIFGSKYDVDAEDTGVMTIAFLKTPKSRRYGNMIWIQGGGRRNTEEKAAGGWWPWQRLAGQSGAGSEEIRTRGGSQESLQRPVIQMDMVTSVVVEVDEDKEHYIRYPDPTARASPSLNSTERDFSRIESHLSNGSVRR